MQVGQTSGAAELITLLPSSSANQSEQANRQVVQQQETSLQEANNQQVAQSQSTVSSVGSIIDTQV